MTASQPVLDWPIIMARRVPLTLRCADGACGETALNKGALARALSVSIPAGDRADLTAALGRTRAQPTVDNEGDDRGKE